MTGVTGWSNLSQLRLPTKHPHNAQNAAHCIMYTLYTAHCTLYTVQYIHNVQNIPHLSGEYYIPHRTSQLATLLHTASHPLEESEWWSSAGQFPVKMYLSQIAKCICLKLQNVFVSNCQMYLSQTPHLATYYRSPLGKVRVVFFSRPIPSQNVFVPNCKMYLSQIVKCICVKPPTFFILPVTSQKSPSCVL